MALREVSQFLIVFPRRMATQPDAARSMIVAAMCRQYPHYQFEVMNGWAVADDVEYGVVPVMGVLGDGAAGRDDIGEVFICRPLDPRVIPDLIETLSGLEVDTAALN